ncbi:hypothetical protein G5B31_19175 [Rhodobacter sp. SGA-6-6]|uniref:hypothetical protein n=1 Tax=Rhodobacter sp. SGA-6-6 TaxID=2710882 RepID=UPI0013ED11A5|nr:hypothetical protein [Rhodobacter sp. SGA-6-6]NGM47659.1 hypothetical protein [Rhodobacter sp. SGA-6-6]
MWSASVDLGEVGWLIVAIPDFSPPSHGWIIFTGWIAMILAGSSLVSLYAARRLSRPLELMIEPALFKEFCDAFTRARNSADKAADLRGSEFSLLRPAPRR